MAYRAAGLSIPRTTFGQWPFGVKVEQGEEQAGDLVFFNAGPGTGPTIRARGHGRVEGQDGGGPLHACAGRSR